MKIKSHVSPIVVLAVSMLISCTAWAGGENPPGCNGTATGIAIEALANGSPTLDPVIPGQEIFYRLTLVQPLPNGCNYFGGQLSNTRADQLTVQIAGFGGPTPTVPMVTFFMPFQVTSTTVYIVDADDLVGDVLVARADYGGTVNQPGQANGTFETDPVQNTASATTSLPLPLGIPVIAIEKTADRDSVCEGVPTAVTCTFTVTNVGDPFPFANVVLSDTICAPVFIGGDDNANTWLDPDETWTYECVLDISTETTSTATVTANAVALAGGEQVIDTVEYEASNSSTITANPNPTVTVDDVSDCAGSTVELCAMASGGMAPYTYLWDTGAITECISVTDEGEYCVVITDANGCVGEDCGMFTFEAAVEVTVNDDAACVGGSGDLCATVNGGTPPFAYLWSNGETTECITVTDAGDYTVTVTDDNGCEGEATGTFTIYPDPTVVIDPAGDGICAGSGDTVEFCAIAGAGTPPFSYSWNTGATTECITVGDAGDYTVTVTDANGCTAMATTTLQENEAPTVTVDPLSDSICEDSGKSVEFCANAVGGTPPYTYEWNTGATSECITVGDAGDYTVTVTDDNGCTATATGTLVVDPNPTVTVDPETATICEGSGDTVEFCANASGGTPPYAYLWNTGATTECITVGDAGDYTVTVTDDNGCSASATATLFVEPGMGIIGDFIWNDDNGDGIQDGGELGIPNVTVELFETCDGMGIMPIQTTSTDINGFYFFEDLCAGDYLVVIDPSTVPDGLNETAPNQGPDDIDSDCVNGVICVTLPTDDTIDLTNDCGFTGDCDVICIVERIACPDEPDGHGDDGHEDDGHEDDGHEDDGHEDDGHEDDGHADDGHADDGHDDGHSDHMVMIEDGRGGWIYVDEIEVLGSGSGDGYGDGYGYAYTTDGHGDDGHDDGHADDGHADDGHEDDGHEDDGHTDDGHEDDGHDDGHGDPDCPDQVIVGWEVDGDCDVVATIDIGCDVIPVLNGQIVELDCNPEGDPGDDGHADDGHEDDGHTDDGHADDGHADDGHADDGHADDGHADDGHDDGHSDHMVMIEDGRGGWTYEVEDLGYGSDDGYGFTNSNDGHGDDGHADDGHADDGHEDDGHGDDGHEDDGHTDDGHEDDGHGDEPDPICEWWFDGDVLVIRSDMAVLSVIGVSGSEAVDSCEIDLCAFLASGEDTLVVGEEDDGGPAPVECPEDVTFDGYVDIDDLVDVLAHWGPVPGGHTCDVNNDEQINADDLVMIVIRWGVCE